MDRSGQFKMCKTHHEERGEYYVAGEPWNKLCRKCALNRAVCGYKIEKDLSPQEFQNKLILNSLVQDLKIVIDQCEKQSNQSLNLTERINSQLLSYVSPLLKSVDDHIRELIDLKSSILQMYEGEINQKMTKLHETKSKYFMDSIAFKRYLENLQANYCDFIVDARDPHEEEQFIRQVELIKGQIEKTRKFMNSTQYSVQGDYFTNLKSVFQAKFKEFESKSFSFRLFEDNNCLKIDQINCLKVKQSKLNQEIPLSKRQTQDEKTSSHKKTVSNLIISEQNRNSYNPSCQFTPRPTNLTLKSAKRNNSIPLKAKAPKIIEI